MRVFLLLTAILCFSVHPAYAEDTTFNNICNDSLVNGVVPDAQTAEKIAEAVLIPIYGEKKIEKEKPLKATLKGDVWHIIGTFNEPFPTLGGVVEIDISKKNGTILHVCHSM